MQYYEIWGVLYKYEIDKIACLIWEYFTGYTAHSKSFNPQNSLLLEHSSVYLKTTHSRCNKKFCFPQKQFITCTLQWRHNERDGVSNHQPHDCLLNCSFRRRSKKHQSSTSLAFVRGIHQWPVNSRTKRPLTREMFPFDDVSMWVMWTNQTTF